MDTWQYGEEYKAFNEGVHASCIIYFWQVLSFAFELRNTRQSVDHNGIDSIIEV